MRSRTLFLTVILQGLPHERGELETTILLYVDA